MFFDAIKYRGQYYEIFINPSQKELNELYNSASHHGIRGYICENGDVYVWNSNLIHKYIIPLTKAKMNPLNLRLGLNRKDHVFAIDANKEHSFDYIKDILRKHNKKLDEMFQLNSFTEWNIWETTSGGSRFDLNYEVIMGQTK